MPKEKTWHTTMFPLGQGPVDRDQLATAVGTLEGLKREWTYRNNVPSFEVWAASTCYDHREDNGGPVFQQMMAFLLTDGASWAPPLWDLKDLGDFHAYKPTRTAYKDPPAFARPPERIDRHIHAGKVAHVAKTQSKTQWEGGCTALSATAQDLGFKTQGIEGTNDDRLRFLQVQSGSPGVSSLMWLESAGMNRSIPGMRYCVAKSNPARQFAGPSKGADDDQKKGISQTDGCVYHGTQLAAYYGLYYYPGCRTKGYTWYHEVHVHGQPKQVRMRLPNPAYEIAFDGEGLPRKLRVKEQSAFLDQNILVGKPTEGFSFPEMEKPGPLNGLSWDKLAHQREKDGEDKRPGAESRAKKGIACVLQGWAGKRYGDGEDGDVTIKLGTNSRQRANNKVAIWSDQWANVLRDTEWVGRMYDRKQNAPPAAPRSRSPKWKENVMTGGLAFGWSHPGALWLYPHYPPDSKPEQEKDNNKVSKFKSIDTFPARSPCDYQPWPDWKTATAWRDFPKLVYEPVSVPLIVMLEKAPKSDTANRQKWVFNMGAEPVYGAHMAKAGSAEEQQGSAEYVEHLFNQLVSGRPDAAPEAPVGNSQEGLRIDAVVDGGPPPAQAGPPTNTGDDEEWAGTLPPDVEGEGITEGGDDERGENWSKAQNADNAMHQLAAIDQNEERSAMQAAADTEANGDLDADAAEDDDGVKAKMQRDLKAAPLEDGAETREKERGVPGNHHFFSTKWSPWAPEDVYEKPKHGFILTAMTDEDEVNGYVRAYGSASNLLLRTNTPSRMHFDDTGRYGLPKRVNSKSVETRILDMRLDSYHKDSPTYADDAEVRELFVKNMRRILSIYWDGSGALGFANRISVPDKRKGMRKGIFVEEDGDGCPRVFYDPPTTQDLNGKKVDELKDLLRARDLPTNGKKAQLIARLEEAGDVTDDSKRVLPPVFASDPPAKDPFVTADEHVHRGGPTSSPAGYFNLLRADVSQVRSDMTVLEWLQTPWHYEYLPYQTMNSVFKDGETYCSGCTRCSRPFFNYEFNYSHYWLSVDKTRHWEHGYWRHKDDTALKAPRPFHDKDFWSTNEVFATGRTEMGEEARKKIARLRKKPASDTNAAEIAKLQRLVDNSTVDTARAEAGGVDGRGYHNWPTHLFLLGYKADGSQVGKWTGSKYNLANGAAANDGPLKDEWKRRFEDKRLGGGQLGKTIMGGEDKKGKLTLMEMHKTQRKWTFRRYINHMYDKDETQPLLVQGVVRTKGAKVCYGMSDYRLMRAIKYGNVCRDCANTLDLAPKLYVRTGRIVAEVLATQSGARVKPGPTQLDTWWMPLAGVPLTPGSQELFDPWFIYIQTAGLHKPRVFGKPPDVHYTEGGNRRQTYEDLIKRRAEGKAGGLERDDKKKQQIVDLLATKGKLAAYKVVWPLRDGESNEDYLTRLFAHVDKHIDLVAKWQKEKACQVSDEHRRKITRVKKPPEVYVQKFYDRDAKQWEGKDKAAMQRATVVLERIVKWLDRTFAPQTETSITPAVNTLVIKPSELNALPGSNRALRDALHEAHQQMAHLSAFKREDTGAKYDPNLARVEIRTMDKLVIRQVVTPGRRVIKEKDVKTVTKYEKFLEGNQEIVRTFWNTERHPGEPESDWRGDAYVRDYGSKKNSKGEPLHPSASERQIRKLTQSRLFITYSLHRRVEDELEARSVLETMADAVRRLFGNDQDLCRLIIFGKRLVDIGGGSDAVSSKTYVPIDKPRKKDKVFYGGVASRNSYVDDTYMTHVENVTVDAGIEIGPTYHHPHFHVLLTINHFSYIQFDTFRMKATLEQMFKGTHHQHKKEFMLIDGSGRPFYTDNENPYIDIRVYPSDNWAEVIAAYMRKGQDSETMRSLRARTGGLTVDSPYLNPRPAPVPLEGA